MNRLAQAYICLTDPDALRAYDAARSGRPKPNGSKPPSATQHRAAARPRSLRCSTPPPVPAMPVPVPPPERPASPPMPAVVELLPVYLLRRWPCRSFRGRPGGSTAATGAANRPFPWPSLRRSPPRTASGSTRHSHGPKRIQVIEGQPLPLEARRGLGTSPRVYRAA